MESLVSRRSHFQNRIFAKRHFSTPRAKLGTVGNHSENVRQRFTASRAADSMSCAPPVLRCKILLNFSTIITHRQNRFASSRVLFGFRNTNTSSRREQTIRAPDAFLVIALARIFRLRLREFHRVVIVLFAHTTFVRPASVELLPSEWFRRKKNFRVAVTDVFRSFSSRRSVAVSRLYYGVVWSVTWNRRNVRFVRLLLDFKSLPRDAKTKTIFFSRSVPRTDVSNRSATV